MPLAAAPAPPAPRPPINRSLGFAPGFAPSNFADQADHAEAEPAQDPPPPPPYDDSFMSASLSPPPLPSHDESSVSASPSPPPSSDDSAVLGSPSPPDSPRIICSQYRQTQHVPASDCSWTRRRAPRSARRRASSGERPRVAAEQPPQRRGRRWPPPGGAGAAACGAALHVNSRGKVDYMQQAMPGLQNLQHVGPGSATGCRRDSEAEPGTAARLEPPLVRRARDRSHTPSQAPRRPPRPQENDCRPGDRRADWLAAARQQRPEPDHAL